MCSNETAIPEAADSRRIVATTCYMCACRCGISVHLEAGRVRYIEGLPEHPVNRGVICAKGAAGVMLARSPARLAKPLKRVGKRGESAFVEIEWSEALGMLTDRLAAIRARNPRELAFFTGRDQSQTFTGWWASQFGTANFAAHGGLCSVNVAAAGLYTIGGSFWEYGEPDWEHTRLLLMFGVAEDHGSNPIKRGLGRLKNRGARVVAINPCRTGYAAIADDWLGIRPGTDGLLVLALCQELIKSGRIDTEYLVRYTNLPWLVIQAPGSVDDGLFARDNERRPLCWDGDTGAATNALAPGVRPLLVGSFELADRRRVVPAFQLLVNRLLDPAYAPERVAEATGITAATIRRLAAELAAVAFEQEVVLEVPWTDWAGRPQTRMIGRPVSVHAMRGIAAHANGFQTCRALHTLQLLLGTIDVPGGFRFRPPFPKPCPPPQKPAGKIGEGGPGLPLPGPPLGCPTGPEDLLVEADGTPRRLDKAFSWEAPLAIHGMMQMVITNAWAGDPYPIDTLFLFMANMSWNSTMNTSRVQEMLVDQHPDGGYRIPFIVCADAFFSEMVAYADLVLPDTTFLERWDAISLLDRPISTADGATDAIRWPVLTLDRDVRPFQDVLLDLGHRLGLPGMTTEDGAPRYPGGYADYLVNHQRSPGIGTLAGWRGAEGTEQGRGAPNPAQLQSYLKHQGFWHRPLPEDQKYFRMANRDYLNDAAAQGFIPRPEPVVFQLYQETLQKFRNAARGLGPLQPPAHLRARLEQWCDPLPLWAPPLEDQRVDTRRFPLHAITQRPMVMYHSWGSQNPWLRQILGANQLYVARVAAAPLGIADGDWVWVISSHGRIKVQVRLIDAVNPDTVWTWNAVGKRAGTWGLAPDAPESRQGFLLNHLITELLPADGDGHRLANADPITGQAAWYDLRVRLERARPDEFGESTPQFPMLARPPGLATADAMTQETSP